MRRTLEWLQDSSTPGRNAAWAGVSCVLVLAWLGLEQLSAQLWFLPAGLRLASLWVVPARRWGWLGLAEVTAQAIKSLVLGYAIFTDTFLAVCVAPWLVYAGVILLLRGPRPAPGFDGPTRMLGFLLSGLLAAAGVSPLLWMYLVTFPMSTADTLASMFSFLYGDLTGQLVVAPLLLAILHVPPRPWPRTGMARDVGLALLCALGVFLLLQAYGELATHVLLVAFAPLFMLGFRHGWAGAAVGTSLLGAVLQGLVMAGALFVDVTMLQLVLAIVGGGALVLGAASTALRRSHAELAERHQELQAKNAELAGLADELRQVTQRLVRIEEQGQRELAGELDYELGQAIHSLGTRISLAFRDVRDEQGTRFLESLREQVREIQDSLRRALRQLRPPLLDSHGLRHALNNGPLRDMLDDAGVSFEAHFEGAVDRLDDDARTAVYRIVQAAVREAVRLDCVRRLALRLELGAGAQAIELALEFEYAPYVEHLPPVAPLPAIRDRVLAERGDYALEPRVHGQQHRVRLPLREGETRRPAVP